jgi:DNA-binding NarL/FixJ family response regulator
MITRVVLVEGAGSPRTGIAAGLQADGLRVIAVLSRVEELTALWLSEADVVVIVDPGLGVARLEGAFDDLEALAIVMLSDDSDLLGWLAGRSPGWAVVPSDAPMRVVAAAVRTAAAGLGTAPARWREADSRGVAAAHAVDTRDDVLSREALTAREREVLALLADGLSNRAIAAALSISEHTVKFHVSAVYGKLGAANRAEAVALGLQRGLVTL